MRVKILSRTAFLCLPVYVVACASGPQVGRLGQPLPLPNSGPRSACEREAWYEVVPTRIQTETVRGGGTVQTHYWQLHEGLGVYRVQQQDPEDLEDVWPAIQRPGLQRAHQARIQPVDDANTTATWWLVGGLIGMAAGIGTAAAIQKESSTGAAVAGVSGIGIGLGGLIGGLIATPSVSDQMAADARRKLLFPDEDDLQALARGIDGSNARHRKACGGEPIPFEPAAAARPSRPVNASSPPTAPSVSTPKGETAAPSNDHITAPTESEAAPSAPASTPTVPSRAFEPTK